jgi:hypothetical protein
VCVATIPIHTVVIGLDLLLQPVHGTSSNYIMFFMGAQLTHSFALAIVPIYTVEIGYLLLQLACVAQVVF